MNSPLYKAERQHLQLLAAHTLSQRGKLARWLSVALFGGAFLITVLLFVMEILASLNPGFAAAVVEHANVVLILAHYAPSIWLIHIAILLHVLVLFQVVFQSSNSILREKHNGTWDLLLLSSQTPWQIVLAKWGAIVRENLFLGTWLVALRFGTMLYLGLERYRIDYFNPNRNPAELIYDVRYLPFRVNISTLMLGLGLIVLFTFANLLFTAAVGIFISALKHGGNAVERIIVTFVTRLMVLAIPAALLLLAAEAVYNEVIPIYPETSNFVLTTHISSLAISLVDNGTLASSAFLTMPRYALNFLLHRPYTQLFPPSTIPLTLAFYALACVTALYLAVRAMQKH